MIPYFDAHCDTISALHRRKNCGTLRQNDLHVDLLRGGNYFPRAQVFALFAAGGDVEQKYRNMIALFRKECEENTDILAFCRNGAEMRAAYAAGKAAALLSVEGAELLGCSLEGLEEAASIGVRSVNITWNFENDLSGSNAEGRDKGLTRQGRAFVRRCGELGVAVDVSHISDPGFWDVLECACGPVIASHSNLRALCPHGRNLTDEMFRALCEYGGVAGINFYPAFLGENADFSTIASHLEHFLELGGENHVGLGGDLDGIDCMPAGLRGVQDVKGIYEHLKQKGFEDTLLRKLFFDNFQRIFGGEK